MFGQNQCQYMCEQRKGRFVFQKRLSEKAGSKPIFYLLENAIYLYRHRNVYKNSFSLKIKLIEKDLLSFYDQFQLLHTSYKYLKLSYKFLTIFTKVLCQIKSANKSKCY